MNTNLVGKVNADQLRIMPTFITTFMVDRTASQKTFQELFEIFNSSYEDFDPDPSNDLRSIAYQDDMEKEKWTEPITIVTHEGLVKDGVHRAIAYLRCIDKGIEESKLPEVLVYEAI